MEPRPPIPVRSAIRAGLAVGRRPALWATAVRQIGVLAAPGWWRRAPFLPLPSPEYLQFRLQTAYGGTAPYPVEPDDLVGYLDWCRGTRRLLSEHADRSFAGAGRPRRSGRPDRSGRSDRPWALGHR
jgi:hypothetical protein